MMTLTARRTRKAELLLYLPCPTCSKETPFSSWDGGSPSEDDLLFRCEECGHVESFSRSLVIDLLEGGLD